MYDDIWDYEHGDELKSDSDKMEEQSREEQDRIEKAEKAEEAESSRESERIEETRAIREVREPEKSEKLEKPERFEREEESRRAYAEEPLRADTEEPVRVSERFRERDEKQDDEESIRRMQRQNRSYIPEGPRTIKRKKSSIGAKIAGITAAAVLFGSVAGVTMFGVNMAAGKLATAIYPTVRQSETVASLDSSSNLSANTDSDSNSGSGSDVVPVVSSLDVSAIVKQAMPSVVAITNKQIFQSNSWLYGPSQYEGQSSGSGIIIGQNDTELLVVTNNHVVENATELKVTFIDNNTIDAAVKGTDTESDLAVIAIQKKDIPEGTLGEIAIASVGDSDLLEPGQGVIAIGNALGYGQSTTVGYVSAVNREVSTRDSSTGQITKRTMIQVDAAINPGNSGGALLNMKGEVIGINAAKYSSTDVEGVGYAIPITYAEEIIGDLMSRQTRIEVSEDEQGYLGIQGQNITQDMAQAFGMPRGVYIYKILDGGAAASSDLKEKDIITKIDGTNVKSMSDLQEMLTYFKGGSTVELVVQRLVDGEYQEQSVQVKLGFRSDAQNLQEKNQINE